MYEARQIEGQLHLNERVRRHTAEKPSWNPTEAGAAKANPTQKAKRFFFFFFAVGEASWEGGVGTTHRAFREPGRGQVS
jgi:hypothetical protein